MVIGVVSDLVALGHDSPNEIADIVSAFTPTRKNAAFTFAAFRMSRTFGVHSGSGPSSKVSAT